MVETEAILDGLEEKRRSVCEGKILEGKRTAGMDFEKSGGTAGKRMSEAKKEFLRGGDGGGFCWNEKNGLFVLRRKVKNELGDASAMLKRWRNGEEVGEGVGGVSVGVVERVSDLRESDGTWRTMMCSVSLFGRCVAMKNWEWV